MNIVYHGTIGIIGEILLPARGAFLLASLAPDFTLIYNETKIRLKKIPFNPYKVDRVTMFLYHCAHSMFVSVICFWLNPYLGTAHLIHIICDWFTHTGPFSAKPLYPLSNFTLEFGREILK